MTKKYLDGFTLVETVVTMVILLVLILGVTFTYQAISKMNNVSSKKEIANVLATTIVDQFYDIDYDSIKEDEIINKFKFPSYIDGSNADIKNYNKEANGDLYFEIKNLEGNTANYEIDVDIETKDYDTLDGYNATTFPLITYLNDEDTLVTNNLLEKTTWEMNEDGSYEFNETSRQYDIKKIVSYDEDAAQAFLLQNKTKLMDLYYDWEKDPLNEGTSYEDSPIKELELTREQIFEIMNKQTLVEIEKIGIYYYSTITLTYKLNVSKIAGLGGRFENITKFNSLFTGTNSYMTKTNSSRFINLSTLYIIYWQTDCYEEKYIIDNKVNLPLEIFFVVGNEYNIKEIFDGRFRLDVFMPNRLTLTYKQGIADVDASTLYTNCVNLTLTDTHDITHVNTLQDRMFESGKRIYSLKIVIKDNVSHQILNTTSTNILGK